MWVCRLWYGCCLIISFNLMLICLYDNFCGIILVFDYWIIGIGNLVFLWEELVVEMFVYCFWYII